MGIKAGQKLAQQFGINTGTVSTEEKKTVIDIPGTVDPAEMKKKASAPVAKIGFNV